MVQAYCCVCKTKETLHDAEHFTAKNGRAMVRGKCPHGHSACVIVPKGAKGVGDGLLDLAKPLLNKAKEEAIKKAKEKAAELAGQLAGQAVSAVGDKIKDKVKGKGIDSVPHKEKVKTMFYGPLGGEGLYLPGSPDAKMGYSVAPRKRPYVMSPALAPAQVAHQQEAAEHAPNVPVNITGKGKGRKPKGNGLF